MKSCRQGLSPFVVTRMRRDGGRGYRGDPPGCRCAHFSNQRIPVFIRHGDIGKEHVHLGTLQDVERIARVAGQRHARVDATTDTSGRRTPDGNRTMNVAPRSFPGLSTEMLP